MRTKFAVFGACVVSMVSACSDGEVQQEEDTSVSQALSPASRIASPADGSTVDAGAVVVKGSANNRAGIASVELKVDNGPYTAATLDSPRSRSTTWQGGVTLPTGIHRITARATDLRGRQGWSTVFVTGRASNGTGSGSGGGSTDAGVSPMPTPMPPTPSNSLQLYDNFDGPLYNITNDGSVTPNGLWRTGYVSFGFVKTVSDSTTTSGSYLVASPKLDQLSAVRIDTTKTWKGIHGRLRARLDRQLSPVSWYTIWPLIAYVDETTHYYFNLKTAGWELGKKDNDHPAREELQEYLATGGSPSAAIGQWNTIEWWVAKDVSVNNIRIRVDVNGKTVVNMVDNQPWQRNGTTGNGASSFFMNADKRVSLYQEASQVSWDEVYISDATSVP